MTVKRLLLIFLLFFSVAHAQEEKSVLIAILARNKAHFLPKYLSCIENLDYPKNLITLYVNTNNNEDATKEILTNWMNNQQGNYRKIIFENQDVPHLTATMPHEWTKERFKVLGSIRNNSLKIAKENQCDFYFVVDCDNFIHPETLKELIKQDKPIIAPLLRSRPEPNDHYSNFFCDVTESGYYKTHPTYASILFGELIGTFKVPVVHCTYLIKSQYLDSLTYTDGTDDYEFVIFSRCARNKGIDQYICNTLNFGVLYHSYNCLTLEEEKHKAQALLASLNF